MTDYGIDVSGWNSVSDWGAVRSNGITFASIKVTESTDYASPAVSAQTNGARNAGIAPGGYHFARGGTTPEAQAQFFASECRGHALLLNGSFTPMLDLESAELRSTANDFARRFINAFRVYSGQSKIAVYSNTDWFRNVLDMSWADQDVFLWIADWNGNPGHPTWSHPRLALHQHTDSGTVPGVGGMVDRDATVAPFTLAHMLVGDTSLLPDGTTTTPGDIMFQFVCNIDTFQPANGNLSDHGTTNPNVLALVGGGYAVPATWADVQAKDKTYGGDGTGSVLGLSTADYGRYADLDSKVRARDANLTTLGTVAASSGGATPAEVTSIVDAAFAGHEATLTYHPTGG